MLIEMSRENIAHIHKRTGYILVNITENSTMMLFRYMTRFANVMAIFVVLQALFFGAMVFGMAWISAPVGVALAALSVICALFIATGESHPVFRLAWVVVLMLLPIIGGVAYVFYHRRSFDRIVAGSHQDCLARAQEYAAPGVDLQDKIAVYLANTVGFKPSDSSECKYFPAGEEFCSYLIHYMNKAESYIFLEFFIIEEGIIWDKIREVLADKAAQGVDVRLLCDGAGCLYPLPWGFRKQMARLGIKVQFFNPVRWLVSARINARNHRKIACIDGKIAFCCGLNLADQYMNLKEMYGHWKDTAVMTDGGCARNLTLMFLSMWEFVSKERVNYADFFPKTPVTSGDTVFSPKTLCAPMLDIPVDRVCVSEHLFINLILYAQKYVYITTPYLMCGSEILSALCAAAQSGVDVRIITPFVADKKLVKAVTESYYRGLTENRVRIFEYLPGFIHAKNIVVDGTHAMVGTVNLDYRSLYLHYECGVVMFGGGVVGDIDDDFRSTLASCKEITLDDLNQIGLFKRGVQRFCRLFAPFL
jgi:cardiolipin synthase